MKRREFIVLVGGAAVSWPLEVRAQRSDQVRRIGVLYSLAEDHPTAQPRAAVFRKRLHDLGWIEGRNVMIEYRWTAGRSDLIQAYAAELVGMRPDAIVSIGAPNLVALRKVSLTIPIVFLFVSDPVGMGVIESMARPGGNATGFAAFEASLGGKWLEMLKEVVPKLKRAAILYNPKTAPNAPAFVGPAQTAGQALGVSVVLTPMHDDSEIEPAIGTFAQEPDGGLILVPDPFTSERHRAIIAVADRHRLPLISSFPFISVAGGLLSYGIDGADQHHQAAGYVDRILKGERPADLPVQGPTKFELVVISKRRRRWASPCRPLLLAQANEVIE